MMRNTCVKGDESAAVFHRECQEIQVCEVLGGEVNEADAGGAVGQRKVIWHKHITSTLLMAASGGRASFGDPGPPGYEGLP